MQNDKINKEKNHGKTYDWKLMKKILCYVLPYKKMFALAAVFLILSSALQLLVPYFFKLGIDKYINNKSVTQNIGFTGVRNLAIVIVVILVVKMICEYGHVIVTQIMGQRAMFILRT
ncbi:hypothetical protein KAH27_04450, partial [bacterium]|nr:hypothetical protein [bacterium]